MTEAEEDELDGEEIERRDGEEEKCVAEMRKFLANSIRASGLRLALQAGYKTATDTSFKHRIKINLANRAVSI